MSVGKQIAIIYCGTQGLLSEIPVEKVREFETEFLELMDFRHKKVLSELAKGNLNDQITTTLEQAAKEIVEKLK
jgi:F-type H+-transporting ATPase subunit alpha